MKKFTLDEMINFISTQNNLNEAISHLSEDNIIKANNKKKNTINRCIQCDKELTESEYILGDYCNYCVGE